MRRTLVCAIGAAAVAPAVGLAQPGKARRIGYVDNTIPLVQLTRAPRETNTQVFLDALRGLGWIEGSNVEILWRSAEGVPERRPPIFEELVREKVDAIVVFGDFATQEAMAATKAIPIVMVTSGRVEGLGIVQSLVRPGGNVTGMSRVISGAPIEAKRLDLLKQAVPAVTHVGFLNPTPNREFKFGPSFEGMARDMNLKVGQIPFSGLEGLDRALAEARRRGVDALYMEALMFFDDSRNHDGTRAAIERHRFPMVAASLRTNLGAVVNFAPDSRAAHAGAAGYVDKILRGAKPAELPVEQPRAFQIVANLRAAKAIGVTLDPGFVARADRVVD